MRRSHDPAAQPGDGMDGLGGADVIGATDSKQPVVHFEKSGGCASETKEGLTSFEAGL